jgi:hypothetical protein
VPDSVVIDAMMGVVKMWSGVVDELFLMKVGGIRRFCA